MMNKVVASFQWKFHLALWW